MKEKDIPWKQKIWESWSKYTNTKVSLKQNLIKDKWEHFKMKMELMYQGDTIVILIIRL
jgi:hypothetical protein